MKPVALLFFLFISLTSFSQKQESTFTLLFGNDFDADSVTIMLNGVLIANNIKLKPTMIAPRNLIIEQNRSNILVRPYYEMKQTLKKIPIKNSILNADILLNKTWSHFTFDLRKGMYLYTALGYMRYGWSALIFLTIEQSEHGPIYM